MSSLSKYSIFITKKKLFFYCYEFDFSSDISFYTVSYLFPERVRKRLLCSGAATLEAPRAGAALLRGILSPSGGRAQKAASRQPASPQTELTHQNGRGGLQALRLWRGPEHGQWGHPGDRLPLNFSPLLAEVSSLWIKIHRDLRMCTI